MESQVPQKEELSTLIDQAEILVVGLETEKQNLETKKPYGDIEVTKISVIQNNFRNELYMSKKQYELSNDPEIVKEEIDILRTKIKEVSAVLKIDVEK